MMILLSDIIQIFYLITSIRYKYNNQIYLLHQLNQMGCFQTSPADVKYHILDTDPHLDINKSFNPSKTKDKEIINGEGQNASAQLMHKYITKKLKDQQNLCKSIDTKQINPEIHYKSTKGQKKGQDNQHFQDLINLVVKHQQIASSASSGYKLSDYITCEKELQLLNNQYHPTSKSLKNNKKRFQDKNFLPQYKSLTDLDSSSSEITAVSQIKWKHYLDIYKNPQLFEGVIEPNDIDQGGLGDCYFLCSLASLAEYSKLIQRQFEYYDLQCGYFLIWLCIDGHWKLYEIDGYIPVSPQSNKPVFSKHKTKQQLWVMLLQKTYAKAYGCYEHIVGGHSFEAIKDLSGAPGQSFSHKQNGKDVIWDKLSYADQHKFIMTCGTEKNQQGIAKLDGHSESITKQGIVLGHAYSILRLYIYKGQKLIQLRNPWGQTEWKGDWSDGSTKWTPQATLQLKYNDFEDDGIFWMPFQDYITRYSSTYINYIRPNYYYTSQTRSAVKNLLIKIQSNSFKHGFVMICQHDHRKKGKSANNPYSLCRIIALTYKNGKAIRKIAEESYRYQREGSVELTDIQEGAEVIIMVSIEQAVQVQLCTYADTKLQYETQQDSDAALVYMEGLAKIEPEDANIRQDYKSWTTSVWGIAFLVFKNTSNKSFTINFQLKEPDNIQVFQGRKHILKLEIGGMKCIRGTIIKREDQYGFGKYSYSIDYQDKS